MLEQQAQNGMQPQNIQPSGQTNGTNAVQDANRVAGAIQPQGPQQNLQGLNPQDPNQADTSTVGKQDPLAGLSTEAAGALQRDSQKKQEDTSAAANMSDPSKMTGATQMSDLARFEIEQKKKMKVEPDMA